MTTKPLAYTPKGRPIYPMTGADGAAEGLMTQDQVKEIVSGAVIEAIKSVNKPEDDDRPALKSANPGFGNINLARYPLPRIGVGMKALADGQFRQSQAFERDFSQAAGELFGYSKAELAEDDPKDPVIERFGSGKSRRSLIWAKTRDEQIDVLWQMGEKRAAAEAGEVLRIENAIKAMSEGAGGAALVPTQYLQDRFQYALVSMTAVRRAGIDSMPAASNVLSLPRESVPAGASLANEAGTLTAQDPTLASQTVTIRKQYGYRLYSNELLADATPAWNEFLANTLVRDVALKQDQQFLEGTGSAPEILGLVNFAGTTTPPSFGANGRTPTFDDFIDAFFLLRAANVEPDVAFGHPRTMQTLSKIKDSTGNYLLLLNNGYNRPAIAFNGQLTGPYGTPGPQPNANLLGQADFYFSNQMLTNRTVGTSSDTTDLVLTRRDNLLIVERQGIEVAYSEHVAFNTDQTAARAIGRAAIVALQPSAVEVVVGIRP